MSICSCGPSWQSLSLQLAINESASKHKEGTKQHNGKADDFGDMKTKKGQRDRLFDPANLKPHKQSIFGIFSVCAPPPDALTM